jgi:REP element-mobilizing transposase RayT
MAKTYTQIYIQVVFAVEQRQNLLLPHHQGELQKYMTGIVTRQGQKLIAVRCMPDHTHILLGLKPNLALSDLVGDIKACSTNHINEHHWVPGRSCWQEGFAAFSYSRSQLTSVINYIRNQDQHHQRKTFRQEYLEFLKKFDITYDERFVLKSVEGA